MQSKTKMQQGWEFAGDNGCRYCYPYGTRVCRRSQRRIEQLENNINNHTHRVKVDINKLQGYMLKNTLPEHSM